MVFLNKNKYRQSSIYEMVKDVALVLNSSALVTHNYAFTHRQQRMGKFEGMQQLFLIDIRSIATIISHRHQLGQLFLIDISVWDNLRNPLTQKHRNNY